MSEYTLNSPTHAQNKYIKSPIQQGGRATNVAVSNPPSPPTVDPLRHESVAATTATNLI